MHGSFMKTNNTINAISSQTDSIKITRFIQFKEVWIWITFFKATLRVVWTHGLSVCYLMEKRSEVEENPAAVSLWQTGSLCRPQSTDCALLVSGSCQADKAPNWPRSEQQRFSLSVFFLESIRCVFLRCCEAFSRHWLTPSARQIHQ